MPWFSWFRRGGKRGEQPMPLRSGTTITAEASPYLLPNDLRESQRLDFQHYALRQALRGNVVAPISAPRSILDVGCGTGRWAHEVAQQFPQARVVGLDIVDVPPGYAVEREPLPPNYQFVQGNALTGLPFADGEFDFVHMRLLTTGIPSDKWPEVVCELARVTAPGGWVESVEATPARGSPAIEQIFHWLGAVSLKRGVNLDVADQVGRFMQQAGLSTITTYNEEIPIGAWGGRIGNVMAMDSMIGLRAAGDFLVQTGVVDRPTFDATLAQLDRDLHDEDAHCVVPFHIAYGQR
jgi:ubiquinone/menaquinone biosynthesis C-methylase UbiE